MEGQTDGLTAARRCLEAMAETQDIETRRSLWRAAGKYLAKHRETLSLENAQGPAGRVQYAGRGNLGRETLG